MYKLYIFIFSWMLAVTNSNAQTCHIDTETASTPTINFIDYKNGTVKDQKTGLMWKKCFENRIWNSSTNGCDEGNILTYIPNWDIQIKDSLILANSGKGFAGYTDWRIPNVKELYSLLEDQCETPSINLDVFPNIGIGADHPIIFSSSPHLCFHFGGYGGIGSCYTSYNDWSLYYSNWLVRDAD